MFSCAGPVRPRRRGPTGVRAVESFSGGDCTGVPRRRDAPGPDRETAVRRRRGGRCATTSAAWFAARTSQAGRLAARALLVTLKGATTRERGAPRARRGAHGRAHRRERCTTSLGAGAPADRRARRRARRRRLRLHRPHRRGRARGRRAASCARDDVLPDLPAMQRQGRGDVALARRDHRRRRRVRRRRPAVVHAVVRHRPARPAAHRRRRPPGQGRLRAPARRGLHRRPAPAAVASPSSSPDRCSTCSGPSSPASCSRSPASTPPAAACSSSCRSRAATASSSRCSSTPSRSSGSTRSRRSTSACACTATTTSAASAAWRRRSCTPRSTGSPAAATCADLELLGAVAHAVRPRRLRLQLRHARGRAARAPADAHRAGVRPPLDRVTG